MASTPRDKYERRRQTFEEYVDEGEIDQNTAQAIRELLDAYDEENGTVSSPERHGCREPGTLMSWLYRLMTLARERDLVTATAEDLKQDIQAMNDGTHPQVKAQGLQKTTLRSYQAALRRFYRYHDGYGVEPKALPLFKNDETGIDPNDMLTKEEIGAVRKAAGNPRDRVIFELLIYTGQRREALRTLRLKDIDLASGTYRFNPEVDGLKGASEQNGKRPLLGAKEFVRDWLEYHPDPNNSEHHLITARPSYSRPDPSEPISGETIRHVMARLKEASGVEKPLHPHAMRHNFVTIAKRDYDLPDGTIKYLIGHGPDSMVMETTYAHLSGGDHVQRAEEGFGLREPEDVSTLTPGACPTCSHDLDRDAKACCRCGAIFTPDAQSVLQQIETEIRQFHHEIPPEDDERISLIDAFWEVLENRPELQAELKEQLAEE